MRKQQECSIAGFCHLLNVFPLWGLLFCGWIRFSYREESREVVAQAERAMTFHVILMSAGLIWMMVWLLARLVSALSSGAGALLMRLNHGVMLAVYVVYALICLYGALCAFRGKTFNYPMIRRGAEDES